MSGETRRVHAFTLVEVLIVVAIIAILSAIVVPVMAKAKEAAKFTTCLSNMSQVSKAILMYLPDHSESFPMNRLPDPAKGLEGCLPPDFRGSMYNWRHAVEVYLREMRVRVCPTNKYTWGKFTSFWGTADGDEANTFYPKESWLPRGYAYNGGFFHETFITCPREGISRPRTASEIEEASNLLLLVESRMSMPDLGSWILGTTDCYPPHGVGCFNPMGGKKMCWAFADGHTKGLRLVRTVYPNQSWTDNPADQDRLARTYETFAGTWHEY